MTTIVTVTTDGRAQEIEVGEVAQGHVLRKFNVTADPKVDMSKALCAALIQQMIDLRDAPESLSAQKRGASIAITLIEGAQMAAVKANFAEA